MMTGILKGGSWIVGLIAITALWMVSASALYCLLADKWDLFQFPYTQWAQAAPFWRYSAWMTLCVAAAAAVPTIVLLLCAFGVTRHYLRTRRPALYGSSDWATSGDMRGGGIKVSRTPL
jgi:hypothetical protein